MNLIKKASLAAKLLISYVVLVVFPFLISSLVLSSTSASNIKNNTLSYINLFVEQISSNIDSYIGELDRMTRVATLDNTLVDLLTASPESDKMANYNAAKYLHNEMLKLMTQQPSIRNVTYVGANGMIYSGTSNEIKDLPSFYEITHADRLDELNQKVYISAAHIPSYLLVDFGRSKEPVFTLTRFLYTFDKKKIGAIVLNVTCQDLLDAININSSLLESGARIVITNQDNTIVADTSGNFTPEYLNDPEYMTFAATEQEDGQDMYFSNSSDTLTSTVIINRNQLFKSTHDFNQFAVVLVVMLIILIILLSGYFSYKLVKPLKLLKNAANECAAGNYSIRIPVESKDEIGSLCSSFNFMTEEIQNLLDRVYHYQLATKQAQLEALQNQISPHFLHNTLEIIRMKALINKDKEVAVMVQTLAKLFRITLDRTSNIVTVRDELEHVETYLTIQNMRFNNRYRFTRHVPEELLDCSIIKLTLQPLVENCIQHGFVQTFGDEEISISVEETGNDLIISVSDNGVGIEETNLKRIQNNLEHTGPSEEGAVHNSIGIVNISDRIRLEYGQGYYLRLYANSPRGTTVQLCIPKNYNMEILPEP
ncbi:cache domain-containing sensor histidine kinase [Murimonas intestini]|uniref:cache domain-containing sensor histidine kinase n=1 Tax=Murimonas intestini TaxID=1337051 RepID=UPI00248B9B0F|nr:histidine kinase [Murimonas intestini]